MNSAQLIAWSMAVLLTSVRLSVLFLATPVFAGVPVPPTARIILILGIAAGIAHGVALPAGLDVVALVAMVLHELVVGAAIAAGLFIGFGAFHFAGRLLDLQIGYGVAGLVDIATRNNAPLLGSLLSMLAVVVFFAVDGHHAMLRVLQLSMEKLPPGTSLARLDIGALIAQFGTCFSFGFIIVAPIVICQLLIDFGAAFMSRTMPQMNVFVMSMNAKIVVGLVMLAIIVPLSGGVIRRVFESIFNGWARVLG